ncbi:LysM peptidoglycan-binding domain-containing protein, partial [bacterium]|nr:LysM peptidoglycan-binding domain-containing protein [bacterium]
MSPDRPLRRYVFPALAAALVLFAAGCGYYVTVQRGDTLSEIAERYDVTVNDLLEANPGIDNPNRILEGQKVRIPRDKSIAAQEKPARERNVR